MNKQITVTENEIHIDFSNLRFAARFPGNSYCRPAPEYTPDFRFSVTLALQDEDLIVRISPVENIGGMVASGTWFFPGKRRNRALVRGTRPGLCGLLQHGCQRNSLRDMQAAL